LVTWAILQIARSNRHAKMVPLEECDRGDG
jgi:hypothetical protein